jgi:hypothetical protein
MRHVMVHTDNVSPVPLYQSETAPKWIRGLIVGTYQWAITIGLLLAALVNNATAQRNDTGSYRIPIGIQLAWSLILFFGMLVLPETPRFLIKKDKADKAALSLSRLRRLPVTHEAIAAELAEVQATHEYEMTMGQGSYLDCFKPPMLKRQLTGMGLQALQQLSGKLARFKSFQSSNSRLPAPWFLHARLTLSLQVSISSFIMGPSTSRTPESPAALLSP